MIYKICLLSKNVIYPYGSCWEKMDGIKVYSQLEPEDKLAVSLLEVSKFVRKEAASILFRQNVWHLSNTNALSRDQTFPQLLWQRHMNQFRHIRIAFDLRDLPPADRALIRRLNGVKSAPEGDARMKVAHDGAIECLLMLWREKARMLRDMTLHTLKVQLCECYCPSSCCEIVENVLNNTNLLHCLRPRPAHNPAEHSEHRSASAAFSRSLSEPSPSHISHTITVIDFLCMWGVENWDLCHRQGFGCEICPKKDGRRLTNVCSWRDKQSLWQNPFLP